MFVYCLSNPVNLVDYTGCLPFNVREKVFAQDAEFRGGELTTVDTVSWPEDYSFALYDSADLYPLNRYREQAFAGEISALVFSRDEVTLISAEMSVMKGGWEWENAALSLFDFGTVDASASIGKEGIDIGAMASVWTPNFTFDVGDVEVNISAHVGSIGFVIECGEDGLNVGGAAWWGFTISVDW